MKKILAVFLVLLYPVLYLTVSYLSAEEQFLKFESVSRDYNKAEILENFGEPLEYIRRFDHMYWGESVTSIDNDGSCIEGFSFETNDVVFHPQRYLFCFNSENKVVSKLVLRSGADKYRNFIETIGFKPS